MAHAMPGEKRPVHIDVGEFVRTRDALSTAYMSLSASIDRAVKAYLDHTNAVLAGDATLDISYLTQPFNLITSAQIAQLALSQAADGAVAPSSTVAGAGESKDKVKKKRAYKARDPNAPKRPLTAYFRYLQEQRPGLATEMAESRNGGPSKPGDLSKEATERWNKMSKEEQEPYKEAYRRALKDYEQEVAAYKASTGVPVEDAPSPVDDEMLIPGDAAAAAEEDAATSSDDSSSDDDDDDEEDDDDEDLSMPPPPPPKPASPVVKKTPKPNSKKEKSADVPSPAFQTPRFSSINPTVPIITAPKSSSPEGDRKRKAPADVEESQKKKRGRKTNAAKAEEAAAAAAAAAVPVPQSSDISNEVKKDKKKKKKAVAAGSDV